MSVRGESLKFLKNLFFVASALPALAFSQAETNIDELQRLSLQLRMQSQAELMEAHRIAPLIGLPTRATLSNGSEIMLMAIRDGRPEYATTYNVNAARTISTRYVHPGGGLGFSLTGTGVVLRIWDSGSVRLAHQEFGGRAVNPDASGTTSHSTHVGGTMIGGGAIASAKGMAPGASLRSFNWTDDAAEMASEASLGMRVSNHSYGLLAGWFSDNGNWFWGGDKTVSTSEDPLFGMYIEKAAIIDNIVYQAPYYLPVFAAANDRGDSPGTQPKAHFDFDTASQTWKAANDTHPADGGLFGFDTIPGYQNAKNILTVAAVDDLVNGYQGPIVPLASFSSFGPADDGRIKPDIAANGISLYSADHTSNSAYSTKSGTSMASPNVSGSLALLIQHYRAKNFGADMRASTLKGLVIHTADETGSNPGPDYRYGWGLMNTLSAARFINLDTLNRHYITENLFQEGQEPFKMLVYAPGTMPLKATMAYTDPAGPVQLATQLDSSTRRLVNDLDLRIVRGTTYFPWLLSRNSPANAAIKADNDVDNVEQVNVAAPAAGFHSVRVTTESAQLQPSGSQMFSLLVSGGSPIVLRDLNFPSTATGGILLGGEIRLYSTTPVDTQVILTSSNTAIVPSSLRTIPAGTKLVALTLNVPVVTSATNVTLTATLSGGNSVSRQIIVLPPTLQSVTLNPSSVIGSFSSTGTVNLSGNAPAGGISVLLGSNNANATTLSSVLVPAGQKSASFTIKTKTVSIGQTATISATYRVVKSSTLTLKKGGITSLTFPVRSIVGGTGTTGTVYLSGYGGVLGTVVYLSTKSGAIKIPASVTVESRATSATFAVSSTPVASNTTATVYARTGTVTVSRSLVVTP